MEPKKFKEQNCILCKPDNMTDEQCVSLPCFRHPYGIISKWKASDEEIEIINKTGEIWLVILGQQHHPPVMLTAQEDIPIEDLENIIEND